MDAASKGVKRYSFVHTTGYTRAPGSGVSFKISTLNKTIILINMVPKNSIFRHFFKKQRMEIMVVFYYFDRTTLVTTKQWTKSIFGEMVEQLTSIFLTMMENRQSSIITWKTTITPHMVTDTDLTCKFSLDMLIDKASGPIFIWKMHRIILLPIARIWNILSMHRSVFYL